MRQEKKKDEYLNTYFFTREGISIFSLFTKIDTNVNQVKFGRKIE